MPHVKLPTNIKKKAAHELSSLKKEIEKLKEEQKSLIETQK